MSVLQFKVLMMGFCHVKSANQVDPPLFPNGRENFQERHGKTVFHQWCKSVPLCVFPETSLVDYSGDLRLGGSPSQEWPTCPVWDFWSFRRSISHPHPRSQNHTPKNSHIISFPRLGREDHLQEKPGLGPRDGSNTFGIGNKKQPQGLFQKRPAKCPTSPLISPRQVVVVCGFRWEVMPKQCLDYSNHHDFGNVRHCH